MGLISITLITIVLIAFVFSRFLVPDLVRYYRIESIRIYHEFRESENNIGEVVAVITCSILIGLAVFVFFKGTQGFFAYCLSDNLIDFFIKSRGVFSSAGVEGQNPFIVSNFIYGSLFNPLIQLVSIYILVEMTKRFMLRLNAKFKSEFFSATSLVYFSFFGMLVFLIFDTVSYLQSVSIINTLTNIVFLLGSKLSYLIIAFGIWHVQLLKNQSYTDALFSDLKMTGFEKALITKPLWLLLFTYIVSVLLNLPLFLGLQWNGSIWVVFISLLGGIGLFFVLLKFTLSKGYNYLGVYMLDENREHSLSGIRQVKLLTKPYIFIVMIGIVLFSVFVSVKGFFFYFFYLLVFGSVLTALILFGYGITSVLNRSKLHWKIAWQMVKSVIIALAPVLFIFLIIITIFSGWPKSISEGDFSNYQTAIVDAKGNLIYKANSTSENPSIPISYHELPEFLVKTLMYKEDKALFKQNNLLFNRTNWHGTSINFLLGRGGSNINQQFIKNLAFKGFFPQEFQRKYSEMLASYQLSMVMKPNEIITNYINNVSFNGGMGHKGIINASLHTFGRNVTQLNELEMLYLIFTLHRGSTFKTKDNIIQYKEVQGYPTEIKEKLLVYAEKWYEKGLLSKKEIKKIRKQKINFTNTKYRLNNLASKNVFLDSHIDKTLNDGSIYISTLSKEIDDKIMLGVDAFYDHFSAQKKQGELELYGAALVVDVKSSKIIGHYGGNGVVNLANFGEGNPMGSIVKPFVLIELTEAGYEAKLYDGKRKNKRVANNYNNKNSNLYKNTKQILGPSLNTPMNNIDEITEPISLFKGVDRKFELMNIRSDQTIDLNDESNYVWNRINYPLGSRRMTIWDIAQAYQTIFNDGTFVELNCFNSIKDPFTYVNKSIPVEKKEIYRKSNTKEIQEALTTTLERGGTAYSLNKILPAKRYMCKTGTTDQFQHGYTVLCDGSTMIVTWVSYGKESDDQLKFGLAPIPNYSGGGSAGKLAAYIMKEISKR